MLDDDDDNDDDDDDDDDNGGYLCKCSRLLSCTYSANERVCKYR